jgi:parallel beta-helix repeat protein
VKRTATVLLCAAACALPTPAWADETTVGCGQVITESIKLANDLPNCPGIGLEVGAPKITIDLNGHTIDGTGGSIASGIDNSPTGVSTTGHSEVKIKDGTITGFADGISLGTGANRNDIERILAIDNGTDGIHADRVDRLDISKSNSFQNTDDGIQLDSVTNARVKRSVALNNGFGIFLSGTSTGNLLRRNSAVNNGNDGILIRPSVTATRIEKNDANINGNVGIDVASMDAATVIKDNRANRNVAFGIFAAPGVTDGGDNRASGNATNCSPNISCTP